MNHHKQIKTNEKGSATFLTLIIVLALLVLMSAVTEIAYKQYEISDIQKKTSNAYYLAESAIEKTVDTFNKVLESKNTDILEATRREALSNLYTTANGTPTTTFKWYQLKSGTSPLIGEGYFKSNFSLEDAMRLNSIKQLITYIVSTGSVPKESVAYSGKYLLTFESEYETRSDEGISGNTTVQIQAYLDGNDHDLINDMFKEILPTGPNGEVSLSGLDKFDLAYIKQNYASVNLEDVFKDILTIEAVATSPGDIIQRASAKVSLLEGIDLEDQLKEQYTWTANPPDLLNSAIVSFSDFVVQDGGQAIITGDLSVKGSKVEETDKVTWEADEIGGVIVKNGGNLQVKVPAENNSFESNNTGSIYTLGNVIATNGWTGQMDQYSLETQIQVEGNIVANTVGILDDFYDGDTVNNSPWDSSKQGSNLKIETHGNIFVEDDVRIDKYVKAPSDITVKGVIVGIGDGELNQLSETVIETNGLGQSVQTVKKVPNPNTSSGVFNLGQANSSGALPYIRAYGMFVNGQPYISFDQGDKYHRLYESIGQPYEDVYHLENYRKPIHTLGDPSYLLEEEIETTRIIIDSLNTPNPYIYAPAIISAKPTEGASQGAMYRTGINRLGDLDISGENTLFTNALFSYFQDGSNSGQADQNRATAIFYKGDSVEPIKLSELIPINETDRKNLKVNKEFDYITENPLGYYNPAEEVDRDDIPLLMQHKKFGNPDQIEYKGIHAFMTAARNVFYKGFTNDKLETLTFSDIVDSSKITDQYQEREWSLTHPMDVVTENQIDLKKYFAQSNSGELEAIPTLIVLPNPNQTVTITSTTDKAFKGIILSAGNVVIEGEVNIEGSLIVGGKADEDGGSLTDRNTLMGGNQAGIVVQRGATLKVTHNPNILLSMQFTELATIRQILDLLDITQFEQVVPASTGFVVVGREANNATVQAVDPKQIFENDSYAIERIMLDETSILEVKSPSTRWTISSIRKVDQEELKWPNE